MCTKKKRIKNKFQSEKKKPEKISRRKRRRRRKENYKFKYIARNANKFFENLNLKTKLQTVCKVP